MKTIYYGDIITMEPLKAEAILVENEIIKKVGTKKEVMKLKDKDTKVVNLKNNCLMPAFIDAHSHIMAVAKTFLIADLKEAKTYQELEFYFEENSTSYNGVIDLLLEFKDKFFIIDYKLANLDKSEYERQLNVYKRYIETKSKKMVKCYLLSVLNGTYKEVI